MIRRRTLWLSTAAGILLVVFCWRCDRLYNYFQDRHLRAIILNVESIETAPCNVTCNKHNGLSVCNSKLLVCWEGAHVDAARSDIDKCLVYSSEYAGILPYDESCAATLHDSAFHALGTTPVFLDYCFSPYNELTEMRQILFDRQILAVQSGGRVWKWTCVACGVNVLAWSPPNEARMHADMYWPTDGVVFAVQVRLLFPGEDPSRWPEVLRGAVNNIRRIK